MKILHLCQGLFGRNNGLDTYILNFISSMSEHENIICLPKDKNKSSLPAIEIDSPGELKSIVGDNDIDVIFVHWTGPREKNDTEDLIKYKDKFISKSNRNFFDIHNAETSHNWMVNIFTQWRDRKHKIVIITHTTYKLPKYVTSANIDALVHVSYQAYESNKDIQNNHFVIYPCLSPELEKVIPREKKAHKFILTGYHKIFSSKIKSPVRVGWLGRLNKYNPEVYDFIKDTYGNRADVQFIFAGEGALDNSPPDNFIFPGNMSPEEFFSKIDIFLYPTSIDSFSLALLEAMAQQKCCIVSEVVKELAEIGKAMTYSSLDSLELYIDYLTDDKEYREGMGINSRKSVLNSFSADKMVNNFNSLLDYLSNDFSKVTFDLKG